MTIGTKIKKAYAVRELSAGIYPIKILACNTTPEETRMGRKTKL